DERPQRDGITKAIEDRNAVLPLSAGRPRKQIGRARSDGQRRAVPRLPRLPAEAQDTGREQRHAHDLVELSLVAMPADPRAGPIFVDENLPESIRRPAEDRRDLAPQRLEKAWKRRGLDDGATAVVVAIAEARHPA